jgi:Antirepressor regulating drug resistance, predicted signal transduction N-terminal membrane component
MTLRLTRRVADASAQGDPTGPTAPVHPNVWMDGCRDSHDLVTGHNQWSGRGNRRIQLSKRTRGCIAWIGKRVVAPFRDAPIQRLEIVEAHIHLHLARPDDQGSWIVRAAGAVGNESCEC